ncbi:translocation/assembly module TamB domain-containing protein [Halobellus captivus]|uniref:hypothetical protein n=1 Tax=Halobellus captivus TaxID=2592614 RepID=UPI0011A80C1D|nr:hypothetical protein [Halobellus captivus]
MVSSKLLTLLTLLVALGLVTSSGAFTTVAADRTASVGVAGDDSALVQLTPHSGPNGAYAPYNGGVLELDLDAMPADAQTTIPQVFNVTNQGTQPVGVWITDGVGEGASADRVTFYNPTFGGGASTSAMCENGVKSIETEENAVQLTPGETLTVSIKVNTRDVTNTNAQLLDSLSIHASAEVEGVTEPTSTTCDDSSGDGSGGDGGDDSDSSAGSGGNGAALPNGAWAYADDNDNLEYDDGEETYSAGALVDFNENVNLVIPGPAGSGELEAESFDIRANKITSMIDLVADDGDVDLRANGNGPNTITVNGTTISSEDGDVTFNAESISAVNTAFSADDGDISLIANGNGHNMIDIDGATLSTEEGDITLNGESISAVGAELVAEDGDLDLKATGNSPNEIDVSDGAQDGKLEADSITVEITWGGTLSVDGVEIDDDDNTIEIIGNSNGVAVVGTPESGGVN